jgi:hypothetical protein
MLLDVQAARTATVLAAALDDAREVGLQCLRYDFAETMTRETEEVPKSQRRAASGRVSQSTNGLRGIR